MFAVRAAFLVPPACQHIFKENSVLFQMVGNVVSEADDAELDAEFTQVEQERDLTGMHER